MTIILPAAEAAALPWAVHHLTRDEYGEATATCDAPEGAKCRLTCAEDCGAETWPCGAWDDDDQQHAMTDCGECHVVLYLNGNCDASEYFTVEGDPLADTYVGPVTVTWDGEVYLWEPAAKDRSS